MEFSHETVNSKSEDQQLLERLHRALEAPEDVLRRVADKLFADITLPTFKEPLWEDAPLSNDAITTTSVSKLGRMTRWIMEILRDGGPLASWQVAEQTMKSCEYVNVYLNRLRNYGIASKRDDFWVLTDPGERLTSLLFDRYRHRHRHNTRTTQEQHKNNTRTTLQFQRFRNKSLWLFGFGITA